MDGLWRAGVDRDRDSGNMPVYTAFLEAEKETGEEDHGGLYNGIRRI